MAFHIRDPETDRLVRELAAREGTSLTEAVRLAAEKALREIGERELPPLRERIRDIQERVATRGRTGLKADKAFFDWLSGEK